MQVQALISFIDSLKALDDLAYVGFTAHFVGRDLNDDLNPQDFLFITDAFKERWFKTMNVVSASRFHSENINKLWAKLAIDIAPFINIDSVYIMFPGLILDKTHKLAMDRVLPDGSGRKLTPLTIRELAQLNLQLPGPPVTINGEQFENWPDFLKQKIFPQLNPENEVPIEFIPELFHLIHEYYSLKRAGNDFQTFKKLRQDFYDLLDGSELRSTNCFYGIRIEVNDEANYLGELLIRLDKANSFTLHPTLTILASWIFQLNPKLKVAAGLLAPVYSQLEKESLVLTVLPSLKEMGLLSCKNMLLSLLTLEFNYLPFCGKKISLWDKENTVFPEGFALYQQFIPLIKDKNTDQKENTIDKMVSLYSKLKREVIIPCSTTIDWARFFSSGNSKTVKEWCKQVSNNELSKIGINWFAPELLFYALFYFKAIHSEGTVDSRTIEGMVNSFLNELIHTYAIDTKSELMKQFRVNILFIDFLKHLDKHNKANLMNLISLCNNIDVETEFLPHCAAHIGRYLSQLAPLQPKTPIYDLMIRIKEIIGDKDRNITSVSAVITYYRGSLSSRASEASLLTDVSLSTVAAPGQVNQDLLRLMEKYLKDLIEPILTKEEDDEAYDSARSVDSYYGARD
jgi:hypothetical protein